MTETLGNILKKLADKAGVTLNAELTTLKTEVPQDIAKGFTDYLGQTTMTAEAARKHPEIDAHFKATIFNGLDSKVTALALEYGLDNDTIARIKAEKNSYEKYKILTDARTEQIQKKYEGISPADKVGLKAEIKKLTDDLAAEKEKAVREIKSAHDKTEADILNYAIESHLGAKNYANKEIPQDVNVLTAKSLLQNELSKIGATLIRKEGKLTLVNTKSPDTEYTNPQTNKAVSFSDLTDSILANNKLLAVNGAQQAKPVTLHNNNGAQPAVNNSRVTHAIDAQLAQLGVGIQ